MSPKRSEGNTRLFSEEDVDRLEEIIYLTHKLGINLAGVEMILRLQRQISKMQKEINILFKNAQNELSRESEVNKETIREVATRLASLKRQPLADQTSSELLSTQNEVLHRKGLPKYDKKRKD